MTAPTFSTAILLLAYGAATLQYSFPVTVASATTNPPTNAAAATPSSPPVDGLFSKNKIEIFSVSEKSRWIQVSQLEQLLISFEETFGMLIEKQKQDAMVVSQLSTEVQRMSRKLDAIETSLFKTEQLESSMKMRFSQLSEGAMKEEILQDDIKRRIEKSQQQTNNRLDEIELSVEKVQDSLNKESRKIASMSEKVNAHIDDTNTKWEELFTNVSAGQQSFLRDIQRTLENYSKKLVNNSEPRPQVAFVSDESQTKDAGHNQNYLNILSRIKDSGDVLYEQIKSIENSNEICASLSEKIFTTLENYKIETENRLEVIQDDGINQKYIQGKKILDVEKKSFDQYQKVMEKIEERCNGGGGGVINNEQNWKMLQNSIRVIADQLMTYIGDKY